MLSSLRSLCQLGGAPLRRPACAAVGWSAQPSRAMSIHRMTRLSVADNSGAKELQVIGHVRKREPAVLGDVVRCVVKAASPDAKVSRKEIVAAVIVRTKGIHRRRDGTTVYADRGRERNDTRKLAPDPPTPTRPALLPVPTPPPEPSSQPLTSSAATALWWRLREKPQPPPAPPPPNLPFLYLPHPLGALPGERRSAHQTRPLWADRHAGDRPCGEGVARDQIYEGHYDGFKSRVKIQFENTVDASWVYVRNCPIK